MSKFKNKMLNHFLKTEFKTKPKEVLNEAYIPLNEADKKNVIFEPGLIISEEINEVVYKFLDFIKEQLQLEEIPSISLLINRKEGMTYGSYNPNDNTVLVYAKNRGLADILRTAAHELVHHSQNVENRIPKDINGRNLNLESEANTKAGDFIYMFGLKNPIIYDTDIKPEETI